ncbi:MAG: transglutaminase family protein [Armatimonadota bacterium]
MQELYRGEEVTCEAEAAAYTGRAAADMIVGQKRRKAYLLNYEQLHVNYDDGVEFQLRQQQVILCPQTVDFLYGDFVRPPQYVPGSRPRLEAVVADVTQDCHQEREKVLALMRFCRDLYKRDTREWSDYIYGGTEEQLIDKGERLCECLGRLMVALCEVAGIAGRIVMHDIGGHITSEIFVDGRPVYIDPRAGFYCLDSHGEFLSMWEIWQNPEIMRRQSASTRSDISDLWNWEERLEKCEQKYFHRLEVNGFENYSLADADRYSYVQKTQQQATDDGLFVMSDRYRKLAEEIFGLQ